jgi:hypothetical protein
VIVSVAGIPSFVIDSVARDRSWTTDLGLLVGLVELALLLSTPMRRFVGVGQWRQPRQAKRPASM